MRYLILLTPLFLAASDIPFLLGAQVRHATLAPRDFRHLPLGRGFFVGQDRGGPIDTAFGADCRYDCLGLNQIFRKIVSILRVVVKTLTSIRA